MALITCPECKKEISSASAACPSCGYKKPTHFIRNTFLTLIILFAIVMLIGTMHNAENPRPQKSEKEMLDEEQERLADKCKNGYASACEDEKALANLRSASGR